MAERGLLSKAIQSHIIHSICEPIALDPKEKQTCLEYFLEENNLENPDDIEAYCRLNLLSEQAFERIALLPAQLQQLSMAEFGPKAEAHFLKRKDRLDQVVYSLIRVQEQGLARELYFKILEGEADFGALAQQFSEGPERQTRGIVGPVALNQGHPNLVQRLRSSAVGTVLEPFAVERWWLVVRLENKTSATFTEDVKTRMARELFDQWLHNEVGRLHRQLVEQASA